MSRNLHMAASHSKMAFGRDGSGKKEKVGGRKIQGRERFLTSKSTTNLVQKQPMSARHSKFVSGYGRSN
jgi:hypothetical protein